jgi:two-component system sensor histidine kinase BaeS
MDEVATLSRLVEDMRQITLSEVGAFDYRREALDLAVLLASEANKWREPLAQVGVALQLDSPAALTVEGDTVRLRQLLRNLFNNVLRHAEGASALNVRLQVHQQHVALTVTDNGNGVADAALPLLFDRFWRGDRARSRATGGSGLGLAICRSIAEAHGGAISASHAEPNGLSVLLTLPVLGGGA